MRVYLYIIRANQTVHFHSGYLLERNTIQAESLVITVFRWMVKEDSREKKRTSCVIFLHKHSYIISRRMRDILLKKKQEDCIV